MSSPPSDAERHLRQARAELEGDLRAGADRRAESLLAEYPAVAADTEAALELVYTEFVLREELGQRPTPGEWYDRFPQWRSDLEQLFEVHDELRKADADRPAYRPVDTVPYAYGPARKPGSIGGYEVLGELGRGGMGVVYKARQPGLNRLVALKVIRSGELAGARELGRFRTEVAAAARLDHPNIVRVIEVGEDGGRPVLVMEYVPGGTLAERLHGTPWPERPAAELLAVLARAAHHAHERGVVHRDLKPTNVLLSVVPGPRSLVANPGADLDSSDQGPRTRDHGLVPKVADFGLAKSLTDDGPGPTRTGDAVGTPAYMSPEQATGRSRDVGAATDVWALGAIFYELLTGHPPFQGASALETLHQVRSVDPVPPRRSRPQLPRDLETVCLKCLAKEPGRRYASAAELADDAERWLRGEPIRARPVGWVGRFGRWCRRNPRVAALSAAVVALLGVAGGFGAAAVVNLSDARTLADEVATQERTAREKEVENLFRERQRVVRLQVADGARRLDEGDFTAAAVLFAAALEGDPDPAAEAAHRVRLGTTLRACGRLRLSRWRPDEVTHPKVFSGDGTVLATVAPTGVVTLLDVRTGATRRLTVTDPKPYQRSEVLNADGRALLRVWQEKLEAWDTTTGEPLPLPLPPGWAPFPSRFSPDGGRRLKAAPGFTIRIVGADGQPVGAPIPSAEEAAAAARFSPDGRRVVAGGPGGTVRVWSAETGAPLGEVMAHGGVVLAVAFSPDGRRVVTAGDDGTAQVWDPETGQPVGLRLQHGGELHRAAFSPDGERVVTLGPHATRVWDARTGRSVGGPLPARAAGFGPDTRAIATIDDFRLARVWDGETGRPLSPALLQTGVQTAHTTAGGTLAVTTARLGLLRVWELPPARPPASPRSDAGAFPAGWLPDGRTAVTLGLKAVGLWDTAGGAARVLPHPARVSATAVGRGGARLVTGSETGLARVWEPATGRLVGELPHPKAVRGVGFTADGRVVTGSADGRIRFWDADTGAPAGPPLDQGAPIRVISFTPDGRRAVAVSSPPPAQLADATGPRPAPPVPAKPNTLLWDLEAGRVVAWVGDPNWLSPPLLSPDGRLMAVFPPDRAIRFHATDDGRPVGVPVPVGGWSGNLTFSRDGRRVAGSNPTDHSVQVWDTETGATVGPRLRHRGVVHGYDFGAGGRYLATSSGLEGTAQVWDVETGLPVTPPFEHGTVVPRPALSPDGRRLLTGGREGPALVWDLSPDPRPAAELAAYARLLANRRLDEHGQLVPLSPAEEQQLWERFRPRSD